MLLLAMASEVAEGGVEVSSAGLWMALCVVLGGVSLFVIGVLVLVLRNLPSIGSWIDHPNGRQIATIECSKRKYVCIPIEEDMNSYQRVSDVLEAAEKIRDERMAKKRKEKGG